MELSSCGPTANYTGFKTSESKVRTTWTERGTFRLPLDSQSMRLLLRRRNWTRRSVVRRRAALCDSPRREGRERVILRFWRFDEPVVAAHPIIFQPANGRGDRVAVGAAVVLQGRAAFPFRARLSRRDGARAAHIRHVAAPRRKVTAMRVVEAMIYQVERPFPEMLRGLRGLAIVAGQGPVAEVEEGQALHPHDFPVPLQAAQVDRAQLRVFGVSKQGMIAAKSQLIVPWNNLLWREGQLLPHGVSVVTPLQELTFPPEEVVPWDDELAFRCYHPLLRYAKDPELRSIYLRSLERHWKIMRMQRLPFFTFSCGARTGNDGEPPKAAQHLREWPLDLVNHSFHNSHRSDLAPRRGYVPYMGGTC